MINNTDSTIIYVIYQVLTIYVNHFTYIIFHSVHKSPKKRPCIFYDVAGEKSNAYRIKCENQNWSQNLSIFLPGHSPPSTDNMIIILASGFKELWLES